MLRSRFAVRVALLILVATGSLAAVLALHPIVQDPVYHHFADSRPFLGFAHGFDVLSNLPFLGVGVWGLYNIFYATRANFERNWERGPWGLLMAAILMTAFGSAYYHEAPDDHSLFWDRLPMAFAFSAFIGITIIERVDRTWGARLFVPIVAAGVGSLLYGHPQDLRFYFLFQGWAVVLVALMLALFPSRYEGTRYVVLSLMLYAAAKLLELGDAPIFKMSGGMISGHTLKHLVAAAAAGPLAYMLGHRDQEAPTIDEIAQTT